MRRRLRRLARRLRPRSLPVTVRAVAPVDRGAVWALVADPASYQRWVAGTARSRPDGGHWPRPGAALRHSWGLPGVHLHGRTTVTEVDPGVRLRMLARVGLLAEVDITITLADFADGTEVEIEETVVGRIAAWTPLISVPIQRTRNRRSLRALLVAANSTLPGASSNR